MLHHLHITCMLTRLIISILEIRKVKYKTGKIEECQEVKAELNGKN